MFYKEVAPTALGVRLKRCSIYEALEITFNVLLSLFSESPFKVSETGVLTFDFYDHCPKVSWFDLVPECEPIILVALELNRHEVALLHHFLLAVHVPVPLGNSAVPAIL